MSFFDVRTPFFRHDGYPSRMSIELFKKWPLKNLKFLTSFGPFFTIFQETPFFAKNRHPDPSNFEIWIPNFWDPDPIFWHPTMTFLQDPNIHVKTSIGKLSGPKFSWHPDMNIQQDPATWHKTWDPISCPWWTFDVSRVKVWLMKFWFQTFMQVFGDQPPITCHPMLTFRFWHDHGSSSSRFRFQGLKKRGYRTRFPVKFQTGSNRISYFHQDLMVVHHKIWGPTSKLDVRIENWLKTRNLASYTN